MLWAWFRKAWRSLSRLRLGVILLALVLGAVVLGTLFPQQPRDANASNWWAAVRDRYGFLYRPLRTLGLFDLYGSLWFQGLLGLLLLSTVACFLNRVWPLGRVVFRPRTRLPAERFEKASLRAQLRFPSCEAAETALRDTLRRRRYRVQVEGRALPGSRTQHRLHLRADRHRLPRLGTLLTHVGLISLLFFAVWGGLRGWRVASLAVNSQERTLVGQGTGVKLNCTGLTVLRYEDGTPRDYRADITVFDQKDEELTRAVVRVNHPLKHAGVNYYLQGYHLSQPSGGTSPGSGTCDVTLNAVHDPGYGLVIAAGLCLLCGVTLTFHLPHRRLWARLEPGGEVALVGSTSWDEERFGAQFESLVAELREGVAQPQAETGPIEGQSGDGEKGG